MLLFYRFPKRPGKQEDTKDQAVHHQSGKKLAPCDRLVFKHFGSIVVGNDGNQIIVHKMQHYRNPDIVRFHIGIRKKDTKRNASDLL